MATLPSNSSRALQSSTRFKSAKDSLIETILDESAKLRQVKPPQSSTTEAYKQILQEFQKDRGRDLYFPFLSSGLGSGPYVELVDGSVKMDLITGIGINFFGHSHPAIISELVDALGSDVMQGNLQPGIEAKDLVRLLVEKASPQTRLAHGWLMCSGTMVNEVALKIIRQKKFPATKVLAFKDCFCGRSTAMQEITDNPKYREGQPIYGEVEYLPFYDPSLGLEASTQATLKGMREHLARYPGKFATLMIELVQGEGGFNYAPKEFYQAIFAEAKKAGLAVWLDEIQTFGRTGELFAFQKFGLHADVDVVTIAKLLQASMVLFSDEYNPKAGLVAGTFSGSAATLRVGRKVVEMLCNEGYLGPTGKIEKLSAYFVAKLKKLSEGSCRGLMGEIRAIGGMIAFMPEQGTMEQVKAFLMKLYDAGVVAFYCGHDPYLVRMLPPFGAMNEADIDVACQYIEKTMIEVAKK